MRNGKAYLNEVPGDGWRETGIALEQPHSEVAWLERQVRASDHLALINQWSRDGIFWQYDPPMIGGKQRILLLRRNGNRGMVAAGEIISCWPGRRVESVRDVLKRHGMEEKVSSSSEEIDRLTR